MGSVTRTLSVAGTAALITAGVAACGGSHQGAQAASGAAVSGQPVRMAYTTTMKAKTATFRISEVTTAKPASGGASGSTTVTGHGQADLGARAFAATLTAPTGGTVRIMLVNGTEYLQVPPAARSQVPGHKPWISVNLNKVSRARLGVGFSRFASASSDNPAQALSQLSALSSGVSKVGTATVAGVPTTEYQAHISLHKLAAQVRARDGAQAARAVQQQSKALGTATVPVDVWIGPHHQVRQIRYRSTVPATGGTSRTVMLTVTFTGFGTPVHVTPPPAGQTTDITSQVLRQSAGATG